MSSKIDRIGERNINNFGSEMIIVGYRKYSDIDVYFPQYDWTIKGVTYQNFKKGEIKSPYEKRVYGVGYIGEGKYKTSENGKHTRVYTSWHNMLERCYGKEYHEKYPTYMDCEVSEEFYNFQVFGDWDSENYYKVKGQIMELDKYILFKHNKIYSPDTCIYVPQTINSLFTKRKNARGESCIGTTPVNGKYVVQCSLINPETGKSKNEYLGRYDTQEKAFDVYKYYKERNIKEVADYYKSKIPQKVYDAMYNYEVEMDD